MALSGERLVVGTVSIHLQSSSFFWFINYRVPKYDIIIL